MPYRDPVRQRAYSRAYQRRWIAARRAAFFADKCCVDCGSTERLELDHVDPATKIAHAIWSWSLPRREAEIAKCVVRCRPCHAARHAALRRVEHGASGYQRRKCRCEVCRAWKRGNNARYKATPRVELGSTPLQGAASPFRHVAAPETYQEGAVMDRLLMVVRNQESEPVVVSTDIPGRVVLLFDDGERVEFDARELVDAAADREAA